MTRILIRKDEHLIKQKKDNLAQMLPAAQEIYDLFRSVGVEVTVNDIHDLLHRDWLHTSSTFVNTFVADKMIEKAGTPDFNGVPIKRQHLRDMIETPDTVAIDKRVREMANIWGHAQSNRVRNFTIGHVQIKDGIIAPKDNLHEEIENMHTHHTETERGEQVAAKLTEFVEKYKEVSEFLGNNKNGQPFWPMYDLNLPGLTPLHKNLPKEKHQVRMGGGNGGGILIITEYTGHLLDLGVIRAQEELYSDKK